MSKRQLLAVASVTLAAGWLGTVALSYAQEFDCVVDPSARAKLSSPVSGLLASVEVSKGDFVEAGAAIAHIEAGVEEASVELDRAQAGSKEELNAAETRLALAKSKLDRTQSLSAKGLATTEVLEQAQAEVQIAERQRDLEVQKRKLYALELKRSEAALERKTIRAPIAGYIADRSLNPGEFVDQNAPVATLVSLDPLRVETFLPVTAWNSIKLGDKASITLSEPVAGTYAATVTVVDRVFDAASGTFGVRLALPNPGNALPAGQRCTVRFALTAQ
jgi:RND family efflux transporter MFP subunit